jgi:ATP-dependent DNA helicase RecG
VANNAVTTAELAKLVGISQRKIKENLTKLKEAGIIKRVGPAKGGHWHVVENKNRN